jgi:hypothetical protein
MVADMACVALNRHLPATLRHTWTCFYLTEAEQSDTALLAALDYAEKLVLSRSAEADDDGADGSADAG